MHELIAPYSSVVAAYAAIGVLFLVQVIVADAALVSAGHVPGTPVVGGHSSFLFRATRAHSNTNENLAFFVLASLTAVLAGANPWWCGVLSWGFAASRLAHMATYYADVRIARSAAFGAGLLCSAGLLTLAIVALA